MEKFGSWLQRYSWVLFSEHNAWVIKQNGMMPRCYVALLKLEHDYPLLLKLSTILFNIFFSFFFRTTYKFFTNEQFEKNGKKLSISFSEKNIKASIKSDPLY